MNEDLARALKAGKMSKEVARKLNLLAPGSYLLHQTWGVGCVKSWDLSKQTLTIDFEKKENEENSEGQVMSFALVLKRLTLLPPNHFLVRRYKELSEIRKLAETNHAEVIRQAIVGFGTKVVEEIISKKDGTKETVKTRRNVFRIEDVEPTFKGSIIPEQDFKKWWDAARAKIREAMDIVIPTQKGEPFSLREAGASDAANLIADFDRVSVAKEKIRILEQILKNVSAFESEVEKTLDAKNLVISLLDRVETQIVENEKAKNATQVIELIVLRDHLIDAFTKLFETKGGKAFAYNVQVTLSDILSKEIRNLYQYMGNIGAERQKVVYETLKSIAPDSYGRELLLIFDKSGPKAVSEVAKFISEIGEIDGLMDHINKGLARHTLGVEPLLWICQERKNLAKPIFSLAVGPAILAVIDRDHTDDGPSRSGRLKNRLSDDKTLLSDLVQDEDFGAVRQFAKTLLNAAALPELDRKSLMARIIKVCPKVQDLIQSSSVSRKKVEPLYVSHESLERKKEELKELITDRIPQNVKDIALARSYGDLRENFEYKSAREQQRVLQHRQKELEREISFAQASDFKNASTSAVNIGTNVILANSAGTEVSYSIMGAWDSDPEHNILSYKSDIGASLLGKKVGEEIVTRLPGDDNVQAYKVIKISAVNH